MSQQTPIRVGIVKLGCIGCSPLFEYLLDERADRDDITVRVVTCGAKMTPEEAESVVRMLEPFKPQLIIIISPNAALPGPTKAREVAKTLNAPVVIITDAPAKKAASKFEEGGFGYIIVEADSMIGARREFLDPAEMALFNADIIRVLAITGVFNLMVKTMDEMISAIKRGEEVKLPKIIVTKELAIENAGFSNPYALAKAMAAYEASRKVADLTTEGCFKVQEWEKYIPLVAAGHELMRYAAKLADEAREIEKGIDQVMRMPHRASGELAVKRKLVEKLPPKRG
ncbi:MAG: F420-dependent methylenetetrahydromethanopterin dehydrogenase [Candidatus Nezhaarchaeota archaeon]|nr:F420-dependent methylenetetrahydromethanopterin dehydrogenase [Candidatus Nezhaarchaeota archaeon]MCX8141558.1 F420-dependent methylenetetrahydromethanopterin dehydrogenase [Candidatus Nezhaarchaeota archaeon]MDW8049825.1 F420-dependent methylenetetrahydromethanopterin dehydrogenase [Nitrososphaerota archaeon]